MLTLRQNKEAPLTHAEMDENFTTLNETKASLEEPNTYTAPQRTVITASSNAIDFRLANNFTISAIADSISVISLSGCIGQSGVIIINDAENITEWGSEFNFKTVPSDLSGKEVFPYFIDTETSIIIGRLQ